MKAEYDFKVIVPKFDAILARGLCRGVGSRDSQMCVEAAICAVLDLPHSDNPQCVEPAIRAYKIQLNDSGWSSTQARAAGLRDLGIAQIGSRGIVDGKKFAKRLAEQTIRVILPAMIRETPRLAQSEKLMSLADRCEKEGSPEAALELRNKLYSASAHSASAHSAAAAAPYYAAAAAAPYSAAAAAYYAADAAAYAAAAYSAYAYSTYDAAAAYSAADAILRLSASLALEILVDMKSPGAEWIAPDAIQKLREVQA